MTSFANSPNDGHTPRHYDTADRYVKAASIQLSGRSLRRWCDENPHLAEALGRIPARGKHLFDLRTAPRFRELWMEAARQKHADSIRIENDAKHRFPRGDDK